ncbi:MAG: trypsin-like peptidase domain-containing protein [Clostridia bacterium]|nr:trypsin-like peptidase domain-containing protein [Clostridia bacterium]
MNEHNEKIIGEEVTEPKEEATAEPSSEILSETNTEQNTEEKGEPSATPEPASDAPAPVAEVKEYWSFSEQVKADKATQKKKGRRGALAYAIIMTCLFAVCFALLAALLITGFGKDKNVVEVPTDGASLADLVDSVIDSVVTVVVAKDGGTGFGSGFVYTDDGYIITNYHVIENAKSIKVMCTDGRERPAELIDGDELSDVAVIRVLNLGLTPLAIGDSDTLRVGEDVIAIGTPVDTDYAGTVTKGIVSGVKRTVRVYESSGLLNKTMEMIQTDTTLNHGNSGGPLLNMRGEVVGINTMKYYASDAGDTLYFSIQINDAVAIADDIIEDGKYSGNKGSATQGVQLGIQGGTVYKGVETQVAVGVVITPEVDGVYISAVTEGYPAHGKIEANDIIVSFGGVKTETIEELRAELFKHKVGDTVTVEVWRNGEIISVDVTL